MRKGDGFDRVVTLYAYDGSIIKQWSGKFTVEVDGASASWTGPDGKEIKISGVFIVEPR